MKKSNSDIAKQALEEAKARNEQKAASKTKPVKEIMGHKGLEPTRYGDWEKKGLTSDF